MSLSARDRWAQLLRRCVEIAYAPDPLPPVDQREACVFRLAGMVLKPMSYPAERRRLYDAGETWLAQHPDQRVAPGVIVQRGWVVSAPWLRDSLQHELELARSNHTVITLSAPFALARDMNTTYFGLPIVRDNLVRLDDIRRLPFFSFWEESARGSTMLIGDQDEVFVYLHDWEHFAELFIKTGTHRHSKPPIP